MGRQAPVSFDDIPEGALLPRGIYMMTVTSMDEKFSREKSFLMYEMTFEVQEPAQYAGVTKKDWYVIGNDEDPKGEQADTWRNSIGMKRLKRLVRATMVPETSDMDVLADRLTGQKFIAVIDQRLDTNPKNDKFKDSKTNVIRELHPVGTMSPKLIAGGSDAVLEAPTPTAPAPVSVSAAAPKPASKVTAATTLACPYCGETMARAAYGEHRRTRHPEEE